MTRRRWLALLALTPVLFALGPAPFAVAGPNADGVLLVHTNPSLVYTTDTANFCGQSGLTACSLAVATVPWAPDTTRVFFVLAAFPEGSQPRLKAISFGVDWDPEKLVVLDHGTCADFEIPDNSWPDPGTGVGQSWGQVKTGLVTEAYWFAAYTYSAGDAPDTTSFAVIPHPLQGAVMVDDATPPNEDLIAAFGRLGFGTNGNAPCPSDGGFGDDEGGGSDEPGGDDDQPDVPGPGDLPLDLSNCAPRSLLIRFAPHEISFPQDFPSGHDYFNAAISSAEFRRSDLRTRMLDLGVQTFETVAPNWRHLSPEDMLDIHGRQVSLVNFTDVYRASLDGRSGVADAIASLHGRPGIEYVECDVMAEPQFTPNDPLYPDQWYLNNTGQGGCPDGFDVNAPEAWGIQDSAGTKIGISDYAINPLVPGIRGYVDSTLSRSFLPNQPDWWTTAANSHGTWVSSIAATGTDDDSLIASLTNLAPNHDDRLLVGLRVLVNPYDIDSVATRGARALDYVCSPAAGGAIRVVNHSWGSPACKREFLYNRTLRDAFRNAFQVGIALVCAAGNSNPCHGSAGCADSDTCFAYPAAYSDYAFAVAAVDCEGRTDSFYKRGSYIDLAAPGAGMYYLDADGAHFEERWWTSFSAPLVSGAISLLLGADPTLTNEDCYRVLKVSANTIGGSPPIDTGAGIMNVSGALAMVSAPRHVRHDSTDARSLSFLDSWSVALVNVDSLLTPNPEIPETLWVDAYRIRSVVTVPDSVIVDHFWPRGKTSSGWRLIDGSLDWRYDGLFYSNYAELDSVAGNTAWFASYTYEVYTEQGGSSLGWYPYDPDSTYKLTYSYVSRNGVTGVDDNGKPGALARDRVQVTYTDRDVRLLFDSDRMIRSTVEVFDAGGRRLRSLVSPHGTGRGPTCIVLDRRDAGGRRVPSGIYFVRVAVGRSAAPSPILKSRILLIH